MNQNIFQQYLIITLASLRVSSELTRQLLLSDRLRHEKKMALNQLDSKINNFLKVVDIDMREDPESVKNIDIVHDAMAELLNEIVDKNS